MDQERDRKEGDEERLSGIERVREEDSLITESGRAEHALNLYIADFANRLCYPLLISALCSRIDSGFTMLACFFYDSD